MRKRIKQLIRDITPCNTGNFIWGQSEIKKFGVAYQIGTAGLLIANVLPWRALGFIILIMSAFFTVLPLLKTDIWCKIPSTRWLTYIIYILLIATQIVDQLWARILAVLLTTMISNWSHNVIFRQQEELIRRTAERETAVKIIEAADVQNLR